MPRKGRMLAENTYYHVFNRGVNKQDIFWDDYDKQLFLRILGRVRELFSLKILAYCLMNNHYHLFIHTQLKNLDKAMQMLQAQYVQYVNMRHVRVGPMYQSRYQSRVIENDSYELWIVRYLHRNPVEVGISSDCAAYNWSSYRSFLNPEEAPRWLEVGSVLKLFHEDPIIARQLFVKFHAQVPEGSDPSVPQKLFVVV